MYIENIEEVKILIQNYFEGIFYRDISKLENCFYHQAYIYGDVNSKLNSKTITKYIKIVKTRASPNDLEETFNMSVIGIEILGKTAIVKLHVPMLGYNYYDYLSLVKIKDEWKIVNKTYTHIKHP